MAVVNNKFYIIKLLKKMTSIENKTSKTDQISSYLDSINANDVNFSEEAQWESLPVMEKYEYLRLNCRYLDLLKQTKALDERIEKLFKVAPYQAYKDLKIHTWVYNEWRLQVSEDGEETYCIVWFQGLLREVEWKNEYLSHDGDRILSSPDGDHLPVLQIYGWENKWQYDLSTSEFEIVLKKIEGAIAREDAELTKLEWTWNNSEVINWLK